MNTAVLILAGGSGIRLWPLSRNDKPKQFLPVFRNSLSFFQATLQRALKITDASHIYILTQKKYSGFIEVQAPQIPPENIFSEQYKRNTAPAIATAMMKIKSKCGDSVSVVLPADHYIADEEAFLSTIKRAIVTAENRDNIVTIGIPPTRPDSAFGYIKGGDEIESSVFKAEAFKEKPDYLKALEFISTCEYFWNSGIFVCRLSFMLSQYRKYLPEVYECAEKIRTADSENQADELYGSMPSISIDYGIFEKTDSVLIVKGVFGWDDIGSWNALDRLFDKDENNNIIKGQGFSADAKNCTIISDGRLTVAAGTEDLFIINTDDVTLVCSKNSPDIISKLPSMIEENGHKNLL